MRFIHFSDIRIGSHTESGKSWKREHGLEVRETLEKAVERARKDGAGLVIISGGLFSYQPITAELEKVNRLFESVPDTTFIIIPGESDILRKNSPVRSFNWADNVKYIISPGPQRIEIPAVNAVIYALACTDFEKHNIGELARFASLDMGYNSSIRIAVAYEPDGEAVKAAFEGRQISYAAIGGSGLYSQIIGNRVVYSGALEPDGMSDIGSHGICIGDISSESGDIVNFEYVPMASVSYVPLLVDMDPSTEAELVNTVEKEIIRRGIKNIYRIRISGKRRPEFRPDFTELAKKYRIAVVLDETEPQYDYEALFEEHPGDMIGMFLSSFRKNSEHLSELERTAMYYGIDALLSTAEEDKR